MIELELVFHIRIALAPARELGDTPLGKRRIIEITGGDFSGPKLSGRVLPGGADWQLVRPDGVAHFDTRYTLETADGALLYVQHRGYRHGPQDVLDRIARGETVDASLYYMRGSYWFETSHEGYAWLNRTVCVSTGARLPGAVALEVYALK
jgi:hypothetical protein